MNNVEYWQIRSKPLYREMKELVVRALDDYWIAATNDVASDLAIACSELTLASFRLLKYVRRESGTLIEEIFQKKIDVMNDAATEFYCLGEGSTTSMQEESDVLEVLSRTAFKEMKEAEEIVELFSSNNDM